MHTLNGKSFSEVDTWRKSHGEKNDVVVCSDLNRFSHRKNAVDQRPRQNNTGGHRALNRQFATECVPADIGVDSFGYDRNDLPPPIFERSAHWMEHPVNPRILQESLNGPLNFVGVKEVVGISMQITSPLLAANPALKADA